MKDMKDLLRDQARKHRARMVSDSAAFEAVRDHFFAALSPPPSAVIAAYWPKGREFDPIPVLEQALENGHICALPVVQADSKILRFMPWTRHTPLAKGAFGILEPAQGAGEDFIEPDIIIVPLLAFDRRGHRLGQGGGYYDATLAHLRTKKNVIAVGVGYADQAVLFPLPAEEHDQKLDWIITPQGAQKF